MCNLLPLGALAKVQFSGVARRSRKPWCYLLWFDLPQCDLTVNSHRCTLSATVWIIYITVSRLYKWFRVISFAYPTGSGNTSKGLFTYAKSCTKKKEIPAPWWVIFLDSWARIPTIKLQPLMPNDLYLAAVIRLYRLELLYQFSTRKAKCHTLYEEKSLRMRKLFSTGLKKKRTNVIKAQEFLIYHWFLPQFLLQAMWMFYLRVYSALSEERVVDINFDSKGNRK